MKKYACETVMQEIMMQFDPWHHQQMMLEQLQYSPYSHPLNDGQVFYSSNENKEEDIDHNGDEIPSDASGDRSPNADTFRLAFAASQWSKLVLNAEGLFNNLMSRNVLPSNELDQIEQWLCLKQEYEECIAADDSGSLQDLTENIKRSLERIEEVTETDEKSDESNWKGKLDSDETTSSACSDSDLSEDDYQSDSDSESNDFVDKLEEYMKKFKIETDDIIASKTNEVLKIRSYPFEFSKSSEDNSNISPFIKPVAGRSNRRISILPNSDMGNDIMNFRKNLELLHEQSIEKFDNGYYVDQKMNLLKDSDSARKFGQKNVNDSVKNLKSEDESLEVERETNNFEIVPVNSDNSSQEVSVIQSDLDLINKQIEEVQNTIKVKEEFIKYLLENWNSLGTNKDNKINKSEIKNKCSYFEMQVAQAKNLKANTDSDDDYVQINHKKFTNIQMIQQFAGDSAKKMQEIESSIISLKKQMDELKSVLKEKEEHKKYLEDELIEDQKRLREKSTKILKMKEIATESEVDSSMALKKVNNDDDKSNTTTDDSDSVRREIQKLRMRRDFLLAKKCHLEQEYQNKRVITVDGKRELLSITEHIEFIDEMIEQKNEIICGRTDFRDDNSCRYVDKQMSIMIRLAKLSFDELMTLVCKYIYKVIDLKDSTRNLEEQINILEANYERQGKEARSMVKKFDALLDELEKYKKKNRSLKKQLGDYHALLKGSALTQATSPAIDTKVTRQKNKLVITKERKEKS